MWNGLLWVGPDLDLELVCQESVRWAAIIIVEGMGLDVGGFQDDFASIARGWMRIPGHPPLARQMGGGLMLKADWPLAAKQTLCSFLPHPC